MRKCTSRAPASLIIFTRNRAVVPRTIESSTMTTLRSCNTALYCIKFEPDLRFSTVLTRCNKGAPYIVIANQADFVSAWKAKLLAFRYIPQRCRIRRVRYRNNDGRFFSFGCGRYWGIVGELFTYFSTYFIHHLAKTLWNRAEKNRCTQRCTG